MLNLAQQRGIQFNFFPGTETAAAVIDATGGQPAIAIGIDYNEPMPEGSLVRNTWKVANNPFCSEANTALNRDDGSITPYFSPTFITLGHELEHALEQMEALARLEPDIENPQNKMGTPAFSEAVQALYLCNSKGELYKSGILAISQLMRLSAALKLREISGIDTMAPDLPLEVGAIAPAVAKIWKEL